MKTILIYHRSSHHAQNSGYNRLLEFIPTTQIPFGKSVIPYRIAKFIGNHTDQNYGIYDSTSVSKDLSLFGKLMWPKKEKQIVHYLHAERDIRYALAYKHLFFNTKFCGTFHKPPEILKTQISKTDYLKRLDGVIAVGINQVDFLKNWLDCDQVTYIPHGIDTVFFKPEPMARKSQTLLFVGQHLRDFDAFNYCIPVIAQKVKNLKVNVVMRKDFFKKITPHHSITLFNAINDHDLRRFYQEASALFLPLTDSTACNSILEALACGTPIITTDVGGNSEYLSKTSNVMTPKHDYDYLIEASTSLLKNESELATIGNSSRAKALEYDWTNVAYNTQDFYNLVTHKTGLKT